MPFPSGRAPAQAPVPVGQVLASRPRRRPRTRPIPAGRLTGTQAGRARCRPRAAGTGPPPEGAALLAWRGRSPGWTRESSAVRCIPCGKRNTRGTPIPGTAPDPAPHRVRSVSGSTIRSRTPTGAAGRVLARSVSGSTIRSRRPTGAAGRVLARSGRCVRTRSALTTAAGLVLVRGESGSMTRSPTPTPAAGPVPDRSGRRSCLRRRAGRNSATVQRRRTGRKRMPGPAARTVRGPRSGPRPPAGRRPRMSRVRAPAPGRSRRAGPRVPMRPRSR